MWRMHVSLKLFVHLLGSALPAPSGRVGEKEELVLRPMVFELRKQGTRIQTLTLLPSPICGQHATSIRDVLPKRLGTIHMSSTVFAIDPNGHRETIVLLDKAFLPLLIGLHTLLVPPVS